MIFCKKITWASLASDKKINSRAIGFFFLYEFMNFWKFFVWFINSKFYGSFIAIRPKQFWNQLCVPNDFFSKFKIFLPQIPQPFIVLQWKISLPDSNMNNSIFLRFVFSWLLIYWICILKYRQYFMQGSCCAGVFLLQFFFFQMAWLQQKRSVAFHPIGRRQQWP